MYHSQSQIGAQMAVDSFRTSAGIGRRPFYPLHMALAASCFLGTLASDIAYWHTADVLWANFSDWLVTVGVIVGYVTVVIALIELFAIRSPLRRRPTWLYAAGAIVALILATFNMLVHTRDAWTSVIPWGLGLSAAVVLILLVTGWVERQTSYSADTEETP